MYFASFGPGTYGVSSRTARDMRAIHWVELWTIYVLYTGSYCAPIYVRYTESYCATIYVRYTGSYCATIYVLYSEYNCATICVQIRRPIPTRISTSGRDDIPRYLQHRARPIYVRYTELYAADIRAPLNSTAGRGHIVALYRCALYVYRRANPISPRGSPGPRDD